MVDLPGQKPSLLRETFGKRKHIRSVRRVRKPRKTYRIRDGFALCELKTQVLDHIGYFSSPRD